MSNFTALYDSCVLYPAPLRDLLMHLALTDLYRAKWTDQIHEEWMRNVLKNRPDIKIEQLERTRHLMNENVRDCLVSHYEEIIPSLRLPDPNDRHVLAAGIHCNAAVIVTYNLKDFPRKETEKFGIEVQHPDDFLVDLIDLSPRLVFAAVHRCRLSLKNPPKNPHEYLEYLANQNLPKTIKKLESSHQYI
ncbi:MAG TPA: PIN domain-containing protein [Gammaproteobacteria bacterium]|nr:PIN domain-containing protein [Gammaproteobacteria bacterium]